MRVFHDISSLRDGNLALALAPALTPNGIEQSPRFFSGELVHPVVVSRGLITLADIVSTRYFNYTPVAFRDPILSAQGDRLRAECFSACNGVYARLDLLQEGLYGDISYGTTNVDIGAELRKSLTQIRQGDKLKFKIGRDGLSALHSAAADPEGASITKLLRQRPVDMPDRWIRALGNCAPIHQAMQQVFEVTGMAAKNFVATLPPATAKEQSGWLTYTKTGVRLLQREGRDAVYISGLHRLSSLKRLMSDVRSITLYAPTNEEKGAMMIEAHMQNAVLTLSLTAKNYQGYSGEGALLESLSTLEAIENADQLASALKFEARLDPESMAARLGFSRAEAEYALGLLAASGKLGYDAREQAYFHRELPEDPDRVMKDNPRLKSAKELLEHTFHKEGRTWIVQSKDADYRVTYDRRDRIEHAKCTCTWYLRHQNARGPCKHILAVKLKTDETE